MTKRANTTNCRRCHALLTDPRRVALGIGRGCLKQEIREAAEEQARREAAISAAVAATAVTLAA